MSSSLIPAILKKIFYHFFGNIAKYDCAIFQVKSIFLSGFTQGHDQTKIPRGR